MAGGGYKRLKENVNQTDAYEQVALICINLSADVLQWC